MSKPSWEDAPDDANWLWIGLSGYWFWGYEKPKWSWFICTWKTPKTSAWWAAGHGKQALSFRWRERKNSLEPRP